MILLLFILFLIFCFCGIPIAFSLGVSSLVYLLYQGISPILVDQKMFTGIDSFLLTAIPLFILAGNLMNSSGFTNDLIKFSELFVGRIRGGLAYVNIIVSMVLASMIGAGVADTAAVGSILIPGMIRAGYRKDFSTAVTVVSSTIGPIIPPSIAFIVYGSITGVSIGALFLAGIIPGIIMGILQMVVVYREDKKSPLPRIEEKIIASEKAKIIKNSIFALMMPVIILGGILGGFVTPTEAAGIAAFYIFIIGVFVRQNISFKVFKSALIKTAITTGSVMILMGTAGMFSFILTTQLFPQKVVTAILAVTSNKIMTLLLINLALLICGMFLDVIPALLITTPIFLPLMVTMGISPLHYGAICVLNLVIGLITPPVGMCLFVGANIAKISIEKVSKSLIPFFISVLIALIMVTYWPAISVWLPTICGFWG
ncbi:TRAP transporter large permease [Candidatus Atribacteria bacterium 1244-E10-H5-B2]|nr:MAG: TRAP transporter large permease [Candidatus Atribacteria bacterium 1244-E10-H5-B2]